MNNYLLVAIATWVCLSTFVFADESPATVRFLNVLPSDPPPTVEVQGIHKVDLILGQSVGPVGLHPGDYQLIFMLADKEIKRDAKFLAGRGIVYIMAPKVDDASELQVKEFETLHRGNVAELGKGKIVRMINLTAGDLVIQTTEGEDEIKPGKQQMLATKESQLPLTVGDEVVATVDFRDLNACSVVFYIDAESKLAAVILPEPIATSEDDER